MILSCRITRNGAHISDGGAVEVRTLRGVFYAEFSGYDIFGAISAETSAAGLRGAVFNADLAAAICGAIDASRNANR